MKLHRTRAAVAILAALAGLAALATGGVLLAQVALVPAVPKEGAGTSAPSELHPTRTQPAPAVTPPAPPPQATTDFRIEAVSIMPFTPVWWPPDQGEGFWQVVDPEAGYPETGFTTFLLAHACPEGHCAGNDARALVVGDVFDFFGELYSWKNASAFPRISSASRTSGTTSRIAW